MPKSTLQLLQHRAIHSELIKIRCTPDLKVQLARSALAQDTDLSTVARDAFRFYLARTPRRTLAAR
jgi:hypothetical protein